MIRFDYIVEQFARAYRPMSHDPKNGNCRFFRMNSIQTIDEMLTNINGIQSPAVGVEVYLEGSIGAKDTTAEWTLFFFCNAGDISDMRIVTDAKVEAFIHLERFLSVMRQWQNKRKISERIDLGSGSQRLRYFTQGPILDNWYAVGTTITVSEPFDACGGEPFMDYDKIQAT